MWCPNGQPLTSLLLGRNNLKGTIPAQLGDLQNLQSLGLYVNNLSGPIPAALGRLGHLNYLDLQQNQLSGLIPVELGSLDSLTNLFLNSNLLAGHIPDTLGTLSHLRTLRLDQNQLSGGIPASLGNLTSLQYVYLRSNLLSGSVPLGVAQLGGRLGAYCDFAGNQVYVPDTPEYRAADLDGDGYICALPFTALFLPDLAITSAATITPASPSWGESFTVDVTVGNIGQADAGAFRVFYEIGCSDCGMTKPDTITGNVSALPVGSQVTLRIVIPSCVYRPGSYYIKIGADEGNLIPEANEYNNIFTTYFAIGSGQSGACGGAP